MQRHETRERAERLAGLDVLRHCDRYELRMVARAATERSVPEGTVICRTGDPADEVFLLAAGSLGVVADGEIVARLAPGAIAGELGPLGPAVRCADLVALTDAELFVMSATALRHLLSDSPGLRKGITPLLARRADENHQRAMA
jgi:CRP-like cAMP-binding protein